MKMSVQIDDRRVEAAFAQLKRHAPAALALAMTRTAHDARVAVQQEMRSVFDRPTPFTLNSMRVDPAKPDKLEASLFFKDLGSKGGGDARTRYGPQVFGGQRAIKRFETLLRRRGLLGVTEEAVPGQAAKLDAYGNMSRGQIIQILSWFQAFGEEGFTANSTKSSRAKKAKGTRNRYGTRFFLKRDKPGRGVYFATQTPFGSSIRPVLMFVRRGNYKARLPFEKVVTKVIDEQLERRFNVEIGYAMRRGG